MTIRIMPTPPKRREGFAGQHLVVLPNSAVRAALAGELTKGLVPTAAGYFPAAFGHHVERRTGTEDTILILCVVGRGWFRIGPAGNSQEVNAGDVLCIPARTPHLYGAHAADPWTISWVHCAGSELQLFLGMLDFSPQSPVLHMPAELIDSLDFAPIYEVLEAGYSEPNLLSASAHLRKVLAELNRRRLAPTPVGRSANQKIEDSLRWMRAHFDQPATLPQLAQMAGLSVPHYAALFKRRTGFPPIDYFLRMKIQRACQMLDTTPAEIKQIAARVGFADPFYFSRLFHKVMGCSPRDYRNIQKG